MSILFTPTKIKNIELKNRFVRSATMDCSHESGYATKKQITIYSKLARGGVGLIITGLTYTHASGQITSFQHSITSDDCIPGLIDLVRNVHKEGARIALQLAHGGRGSAAWLGERNEQALAPSFIPDDPYFPYDNYRPLTEEEIWEIIHSFGTAARRAKEAGFDAVQLHAAHAYLPSQFLSPFTNRRTDKWGGSLENRLRIHREIYQAIRNNVGSNYPLLIKLGVQDGFQGGLQLNEGKLAAIMLAERGFDAIEISQGLRGEWFEGTEFRTRINSIEYEAYFREWCRAIKPLVNVPVMIVGGLRTFTLMEEIVQNAEADMISLCRPLICEPDLINKWKNGDRNRAQCISCNKCTEILRNGDLLYCAQKKPNR